MNDKSFWAITSYFNPSKYKSRLNNYRLFRQHLQIQLVTVELSFDGRFDLAAADADILVQKNCMSTMWQKERLLNIALQNLPPHCDKVAWLDCDIIFGNNDWPSLVSQALEKHKLIQPFQEVYELAPGQLPNGNYPTTLEPNGYALSYLLKNGTVQPEVLRGNMRVKQGCNSGLAWAAKRKLLEQDGFYDACVMGSGNRAMVCGALGRPDYAVQYLKMNHSWQDHYLAWAKKHYETVGGDIDNVKGGIYHLWHGHLKNRQYHNRHIEFSSFNFDPFRDLALDDSLCWSWNSNKPEMHQFAARYFGTRLEDDQ